MGEAARARLSRVAAGAAAYRPCFKLGARGSTKGGCRERHQGRGGGREERRLCALDGNQEGAFGAHALMMFEMQMQGERAVAKIGEGRPACIARGGDLRRVMARRRHPRHRRVRKSKRYGEDQGDPPSAPHTPSVNHFIVSTFLIIEHP